MRNVRSKLYIESRADYDNNGYSHCGAAAPAADQRSPAAITGVRTPCARLGTKDQHTHTTDTEHTISCVCVSCGDQCASGLASHEASLSCCSECFVMSKLLVCV